MDSSLLLRLLQSTSRQPVSALPGQAAAAPGALPGATAIPGSPGAPGIAGPTSQFPTTVELEARVLSATLLRTGNAGSTTAAAGLPRYRVQLEIAGQPRITATLSAASLAAGQTVRLSVDAGGQLRLTGAPPALLVAPAAIASGSGTTANNAPVELVQLQHWARVLLPRQQPLHQLVPILQRWLAASATAGTAMVNPVSTPEDLARLWLSRLPTPDLLSETAGLRNALRDSGTLTESLWREALTSGSAAPRDQKSLLTQLLRLIQRPTGSATQPPVQNPLRAGGHGFLPPLPGATTSAEPATAAPQEASANLTEAVLRQLSAAIARTQLHQLDSLGTRQSHSADPQQPNATWSFEVPVRDGHHTSSMELQIRRRDGRRADPAQVRWQVDIRLDLHHYGLFSARLDLLGQQASATLWAEQAHTHQKVRQHLAALRLGLEAVGVQVSRLDCRRGTPPSSRPAFRRQLVDLRT